MSDTSSANATHIITDTLASFKHMDNATATHLPDYGRTLVQFGDAVTALFDTQPGDVEYQLSRVVNEQDAYPQEFVTLIQQTIVGMVQNGGSLSHPALEQYAAKHGYPYAPKWGQES